MQRITVNRTASYECYESHPTNRYQIVSSSCRDQQHSGLLSFDSSLLYGCSFSVLFSRPPAISASSIASFPFHLPYICPRMIFFRDSLLSLTPTPLFRHSRYVPFSSYVLSVLPLFGWCFFCQKASSFPSSFLPRMPFVPLSLQLHPDPAPSDTTSVNWFTIGRLLMGCSLRVCLSRGKSTSMGWVDFSQSKIG